jgi:hypothetical protein
VTAGVNGTAGHVDVYGTQAAGRGVPQTGDPVRRHEPMQAAVVVCLQWRLAFLMHRWAFARGAVGHDAVAAATHADIVSPQVEWHRRHAAGVAAQDPPAVR